MVLSYLHLYCLVTFKIEIDTLEIEGMHANKRMSIELDKHYSLPSRQ
jgi:hypothetical protein